MVRQILPWQPGGQLLDVFCREMEDLAGRLHETNTTQEENVIFRPRTNVAETETGFEITLDIPGVTADDFSIEMHDGRLTISGERAKEVEADKTFHRSERRFGKFQREFKIGLEVDADGITAEYANGVLTVNVPKTEKAQPKRIQVTT